MTLVLLAVAVLLLLLLLLLFVASPACLAAWLCACWCLSAGGMT
jgi:hypothetical protein